MSVSDRKIVDLVLRMSDGDELTIEEKERLKSLKELDLSRTQIRSLECLSDLTDLQTLCLSNTSITSLKGLEELKNLQVLELRGTKVSSLEELSGLFNLQRLILSDTLVGSLDELGELVNLQTLWLSNTLVSSLRGLSRLVNLQKLYLSGTQVSSLEGLSGLANLQELWLNKTHISSLEGLGGLASLQTLWLNDTQVSLLAGLSGLVNLRTLRLENTQVSSLEGLNGLINLQELWLNNTQVSSLEGLNGLTNLQELWLNNTQVNSLEGLDKLVNLKKLGVANTSLDKIPQWLVERKLPFSTDDEWYFKPVVCMKDVQLSEQPVSLFAQPRELIEAYYQKEQVPVCEAKVIFIGAGGVGKTYTIYRIEHNDEEPESTEMTPGVSITRYDRKDRATINFWDFGGQEIMYSMHRFFLTERTCYVVTVSNRYSAVTEQARMCLRNIKSFAPDSKIILAINKWEGVPAWDLDSNKLRREFPNLLRIVEYTATDSTYELLRNIEDVVDAMPSVRMKFPKSWTEIMMKLRNMSDESGVPRNYITKAEYQKICHESELQSNAEISDWLLKWFNDLGVCFSYDKDEGNKSRLTDNMILKPEWLTNAVYIIVINGKNHTTNGHISHKKLFEILAQPERCVNHEMKYSEDELNFILEVMRKFQLSYNAGDGYEFVPVLCRNQTPDNLFPMNFEDCVRFELKYDYLPDTVVQRLMIDCYKDLDRAKSWSKGFCLGNCETDDLFTVCEMDGEPNNLLFIDVYKLHDGKANPQTLAATLLNKLAEINDSLNLKPKTFVCSNDRKAKFQLTALLKAWAKGVKQVFYVEDGDYESYEIQELLEQVFDDSNDIELLLRMLLETDGKEKSEIIGRLYKKNPFLKPVLEELIPIASQTDAVTLPNARSRISENDSYKSFSTLSEQLEQFRNELRASADLNEDQQDFLFDLIGDLIDNLDEPNEKQAKFKKRIKKGIKALGEPTTSALRLARENFKDVAAYLEL